MASGTINLSSNISTLAGRINWNSTSNGSVNNSSNVYAELQIHRTDSYTTTGTWNGSLTIDGKTESFSSHLAISSSWVTIKSFTKNNIAHDSDGKKSITISGSCNGPSGTTMAGHSVSGSSSVTLDNIPRYIANFSYTAKPSINSIFMDWTTENDCSAVRYGTNPSSLTEISASGKSGSFEIKDLNPDNQYTVYLNFKRKDSGLYRAENYSFTIRTTTVPQLSSVPNVVVGSSHTITWTRASSSTAVYTTSLKLCKTNNEVIQDFGQVTGTSKNITPDSSLIYPLMKNSNSYTARYILTTTSNGKSYTSSKDFTFTLSGSNPTFSNFTYADTNSTTINLTGNDQILIKGFSNNKVTITSSNKATAKNGATMKSYKFSQGNQTTTANYSSSGTVTMTLNNIDSNIMSVYAIDSRGNSTEARKELSSSYYKDYSRMEIKSYSLERTNNGAGTNVTLSFSGTYWNQSFGSVTNSINSITYQYKETTSNSWSSSTSLNYSASGGTFRVSQSIRGDLGADGFTIGKSFNIRINTRDKLETRTTEITLGSAAPAIAIYKDNVAIGQKYDTSDNISKLQINGDIGLPASSSLNFNRKPIFTHIGSSNTTYISTSTTDGYIRFRPNGEDRIDGQVYLRSDGWLIGNTFVGALSGNASSADTATTATTATTANRLKTSRNINGVSFDGSQNINLGTVLYENGSGTNGTVSLNSSVSNFTYIEIYFQDTSSLRHNSVKVYPVHGNQVSAAIFNRNTSSSSTIRTNVRTLSVSGSTISVLDYIVKFLPETATYDSNEQKIHKVVGYKGV